MKQRYTSTKALQDLNTWALLAPAIIFFIGYQIYPIIRVIWISFTDFEFLTNEPANWVGLTNYIEAFNDPLMWTSLWRAALFTMMFLPGTIIFPLLLAILVDRVREPGLATFYRVVLLIPAIIPSTLVFVLWKWMYNYQVGPINFFLVEVLEIFTFHNAPQWLGGTPLTLPSIAIMEIWWGLGYHTIFFLAGLAVIPKDLNEAARLDGASEWQLFWHVTMPRLAPIMMILVVLRFGTSMAVIDEYLIFGGFNRASADLYLDHLHVRPGLQDRPVAPGLRGGDRHDRVGGHDVLRDHPDLHLPAAGLRAPWPRTPPLLPCACDAAENPGSRATAPR